MTLLINAVKKAASPLNRDFSEIERLQSSVKSYKDFVVSAYGKVDRALRTELGRIKSDFPIAVDGQPKPKGSCFVVAPIDGLNNFAHGSAVCLRSPFRKRSRYRRNRLQPGFG